MELLPEPQTKEKQVVTEKELSEYASLLVVLYIKPHEQKQQHEKFEIFHRREWQRKVFYLYTILPPQRVSDILQVALSERRLFYLEIPFGLYPLC